jgi:hypothetical protein
LTHVDGDYASELAKAVRQGELQMKELMISRIEQADLSLTPEDMIVFSLEPWQARALAKRYRGLMLRAAKGDFDFENGAPTSCPAAIKGTLLCVR